MSTTQMWEVSVVKPLVPGHRTHAVIYYFVIADTEVEAGVKIREFLDERCTRYEQIRTPRAMGSVQYVSVNSITPAELLRSKGIEVPTKAKPEPRLSTRPLGDTQLSVLKSLLEYKGWSRNCGWLWNTDSGTARILDGLVQRCLVNKLEGRYMIGEAGIAELVRRRLV